MLKTCCPSGSLESWHLFSASCLHGDPPIKTLSAESLSSFPTGSISHVLSWLAAGGINRILCDSSGRGPWKACGWFPLDLSHTPFPFAASACHLFAEINQSHGYNYKMRQVHPPSKSLNLGWPWGPLPHHCSYKILQLEGTIIITDIIFNTEVVPSLSL